MKPRIRDWKAIEADYWVGVPQGINPIDPSLAQGAMACLRDTGCMSQVDACLNDPKCVQVLINRYEADDQSKCSPDSSCAVLTFAYRPERTKP